MSRRDEVAREQAHVDRAYAQLDVLRSRAREIGDAGVVAGRGGNFQAQLDRDVFVYRSALRLAELEMGDEPLVFGRIDTTDDETFHIGRIGVPGPDLERLVVDWRAPAAAPFYRATPGEPLGVVRRRSLLCRGQQVVDLEDDLLDQSGADDLTLVGEGALLAAVTRARSDRMRDIVATIQAEQDEIIRAPARGILTVQGGPGTGKTAVALHRVAYLLYTERERLERRGVLLVGPSRDLLRYVERVLPSLGEQSARLRTLGSLVAGVDATRREESSVARVLGDERMAEVLARTIPLAAPVPRGEIGLEFDAQPFTVTADTLLAARRDTAGERLPWNERRHHARVALIKRLWRLWRRRLEQSVKAGERRRYDGEDLSRLNERFQKVVGGSDELYDLLDVTWPVVSPQRVLDRFRRDARLRAAAARGLLDDDELRVLDRLDPDAPWSVEEVALIDELDARIGAPPRVDDDDEDDPFAEDYAEVTTFADREAITLDANEPEVFGHVVVDEAQDLSPMQWRMVARRGAGASYTIVGDLAQASGQWRPTSWSDATRPLGPRPREDHELTVNYRTPSEVMELAGRVLAVAAPTISPPTSVRDAGEHPRLVVVDDLEASVIDETADLVARTSDGTVAVIAPEHRVASVAALLDEADLRATVTTATGAKGLEFDAVLIVAPGDIVAEAGDGLRALYVALTRATQRVTVIDDRPFPDILSDGNG